VSSNPGFSPSPHQPYGIVGGKKEAAQGHHPQQQHHLPHQHPNVPPHLSDSTTTASPSQQLVYSNIPELMGSVAATQPAVSAAAGAAAAAAGGHHSDRDLSEAERSDYDNEQHDKGGVDYDDEDDDDDEDDLPLGTRRRGAAAAAPSAPASKPTATADISSWGQATTTAAAKPAKELKIKLGPPPPTSPSRKVKEDVPPPAPKPEVLTKRGTRMPCYREEAEDEPEAQNRRPVSAKVPCYKVESQPSSGAGQPVGGGPTAAKGKLKSGRGGPAARLFGRKAGVKYDKKAFEAVHQKLAGTDFDIEGEFDDDFGDVPKEDGLASLRDFRVASKNKRNESFESSDMDLSTANASQIPPLQYDFDDEGSEDNKSKPPAQTSGRGRGKAAKPKKPVPEPEAKLEKPPVQPKVIPLKIKNSSTPVPPVDEEAVALPKIPKIKIKFSGKPEPSLLRQVRKEDRRNKPPLAETGEEQEKKSLKLTIKVPKRPVTPERPLNGGDQPPPIPQTDNPVVGIEGVDVSVGGPGVATTEADDALEPPTLIVRPMRNSPAADKALFVAAAGRTPVQDKSGNAALLLPLEKVKDSHVNKSSPGRDAGAVKSLESTVAGVESGSNDLPGFLPPPALPADPSPRKPKGGSSIDSLASKLLAKQQTSSTDQASELVAIFGPEEPVNIISDNPPPPPAITAADRADDGPSELDLLTMELKKLEREQQQKDESAAAADKSATSAEQQQQDLGESAVAAETAAVATQRVGVEAADPRQEEYDEGAHHSKIHHHQLKYKFKPQQLHPQPAAAAAGEPGGRSSSPLSGPSSHFQPPVKISLSGSASSAAAAASVVDIHMRRMRKKELLNSYLGIEAPPVPLAAAAAVLSNGPVSSHYHHTSEVASREPVRMNIIKMPKAVASVTSVPTRADYQSQLEANLERKRKREGKEDLGKAKGQKKGKGKQGRLKDDWEPYKPKIKKNADSGEESETKSELRVRTRGKPPKKCLREESPERDEPLDSFKKTNLRYAEEIRKQFDLEGQDEAVDVKVGGVGADVSGGVGGLGGGRRKDKKRRLDDEDPSKEGLQPKGKSPRIVIKISKNKDLASKVMGKDNNGLTQPVATNNELQSLKVQPLKIKL
jgi:hypothetical protein